MLSWKISSGSLFAISNPTMERNLPIINCAHSFLIMEKLDFGSPVPIHLLRMGSTKEFFAHWTSACTYCYCKPHCHIAFGQKPYTRQRSWLIESRANPSSSSLPMNFYMAQTWLLLWLRVWVSLLSEHRSHRNAQACTMICRVCHSMIPAWPQRVPLLWPTFSTCHWLPSRVLRRGPASFLWATTNSIWFWFSAISTSRVRWTQPAHAPWVAPLACCGTSPAHVLDSPTEAMHDQVTPASNLSSPAPSPPAPILQRHHMQTQAHSSLMKANPRFVATTNIRKMVSLGH
jgi:hypothetical protein